MCGKRSVNSRSAVCVYQARQWARPQNADLKHARGKQYLPRLTQGLVHSPFTYSYDSVTVCRVDVDSKACKVSHLLFLGSGESMSNSIEH